MKTLLVPPIPTDGPDAHPAPHTATQPANTRLTIPPTALPPSVPPPPSKPPEPLLFHEISSKQTAHTHPPERSPQTRSASPHGRAQSSQTPREQTPPNSCKPHPK